MFTENEKTAVKAQVAQVHLRTKFLKNFNLLQSDPDTREIFLQPPLISWKRNKKHM